MKQYVVQRVQPFTDHLVLTLTPQFDDDRLRFWPGQYAAFSFHSGSRLSPMRCFSISSSPNSHELEFAMRPHGRFTGQVMALQPGDEVDVRGPFGNFVIDPADKSIIMLAAGIGITPFMSMLRYATEAKLDIPITLLYGVRSSDDIPFADELRILQARNSKLRVAFLVQSGGANAGKQLYSGRIDERLLQRVTNGNLQPHTFFICGPRHFNSQMQRLLRQQGVMSNQIVTEAFNQGAKFVWRPSLSSIPGMTYALTGLLLLVGIGSVMALDLFRYVPKKAAALNTNNTTVTPATSTTTDQSTDTSTDQTEDTSTTNTDSTTTTNNTDSSTSSDTSTATSPSTTQQNQYQPPMSSVS